MNAPRCLTAPTCRIPKEARGTYSCPHCQRVWVQRNDFGHGLYWQHTPPKH